MKRSIRTAVFLSVVLLGAVGVFAETIELVTYYPTPAGGNTNTGRLNASQGTFGNPYSIDNPADAVLTDGTLLVADRVGIGPVFGTTPPAGALHVVGVANQPDRVLFMPGAGTGTLNVGIGILAPVFPLEVTRDQNGTVTAGAFSNPNAGNQAVTDLRVGQDVETNNGRYGALDYYGSGVPAGFQGYGNPNQVSLVAASGAVNGLSIATNANAPIKFLTNTNGANNEQMRITGAGNVGIGNAYAPGSAVPNGAASGNLDVNDVYLRSTGRWASQAAGSQRPDAAGTYTGNGVADRAINTGFPPGHVMVWIKHGNHIHCQEIWAGMPLVNNGTFNEVPGFAFVWGGSSMSGGNDLRQAGLYIVDGENGFHVGGSNADLDMTNQSGQLHRWMAWR